MQSVRIWSFFGPNAGKYGPEKLQIRTLFTQCLLNNGLLKFPKDNMNSIAALRKNALTWSCVEGHRKELSELMKIRFDLITFYQCFECCQREFALLHRK